MHSPARRLSVSLFFFFCRFSFTIQRARFKRSSYMFKLTTILVVHKSGFVEHIWNASVTLHQHRQSWTLRERAAMDRRSRWKGFADSTFDV
jgi:hypothetical protein